MKKHLLTTIALLGCLFAGISNAFAAHLVGGELTYSCLGNDNYTIELSIYRDCNCINCAEFDDPANVSVYDGDGNLASTFSLFSPDVSNIDIDTQDFCIENIPDVCVERGYYQLEVNLPPSSNGYQIVYQRCCRNNTIDNLVSPGEQGSTYLANIPPSTGGGGCDNSSPQFDNFPPIVICADSPLIFDHSATDADGDSLVYSICQPFQGASSSDPMPTVAPPPPYDDVVWAAPYSAGYPLASDPAMVIDPVTGQITAYPNTVGQFVVGICVSEYRDGVLLSTNTRDFQFNVADCVIVEAIASVEASNDTICLGQSVQLSGQQFSGDSWFWEPIFSLNNPNILNPIATPTTTTTYTLSVVNSVVGCSATSQVTIHVIDPVTADAGDDQTFCPGQTVQLNGSGGAVYSWQPTAGLSNPNIANPIATPTSTTTYTLTVSDESGTCTDTDQVTISVGSSGNPGDMPNDQVVLCDGNSTDLSASGVQLDEGSILGYILHTTADNTAGTVLASSLIGVFSNTGSPLQYNTVYYVSSVVGPADANGFPDLTNGCTRIAPGTPVVFLSPLQLLLNEYCDWEITGDLTVTVGGSGGYPAFNNTQNYIVGGDQFNNVAVAPNATIQTVLNEGQGTHSYTLSLNDGYCPIIEQVQSFVCFKTPIELTRFDGKALAEGNQINWTTASETDNDYFTLQYAANGVQFVNIATIDGAGTKPNSTQYTYLDKNATAGIGYYRLQQTDFNGNHSTSNTISIERRNKPTQYVSVMPVPATDFVQISFANPNNTSVAIHIYDAIGRLVETQYTLSNTHNLCVNGYGAGLYFVHVQTGNEVQIAKIVKK